MRSKLPVTLAFCAGVIGLAAATPAGATIISLSATDFIAQCTSFCPSQQPRVVHGVIGPQSSSTMFHSVELPNGQQVCAFTLVYQDINNADSLTARLLRKVWVANGNVDNTPVEMARVATAATVVQGVRVAADTTILSNPINNANSFYYVDVSAPTVNLRALGVIIDVRPTCP